MKKALMIYGGWKGHEPKECTLAAQKILEDSGFETVLSDSLNSYLDNELMAWADLIVQCTTMAEITDEQAESLIQTVKSGTGLAGWHGGLCDSFRNCTEYHFMTGGQWVSHPGGDKVSYTVNITKPQDPVMAGIENFSHTSEQYYLHVDPGVDVLAETEFSGEHDGIDWIKGVVMPVAWKKRWGSGRVFYLALGHTAKELEIPQIQTILKRGMLWASK
ncbi:Trehalose utilization [Limihaloglobus sulfuriphilus]|uniref:Trehalose utilization n=1 Tax=Limihaloglobus sulfuriphilus TaxID=1851148 RepID=A0A1Q2MBT7_9BACT|nr:ThuA domain-containing protein [Limihaloglobus sulfuriphilus]AQQ70134.1 Trehalose utilization [Limihaloglobus sulfuriphilus]